MLVQNHTRVFVVQSFTWTVSRTRPRQVIFMLFVVQSVSWYSPGIVTNVSRRTLQNIPTHTYKMQTLTQPCQLTVPEIVPDPSKSPGRILHPVTLWCTSCWRGLQYMYLKLLCETICVIMDYCYYTLTI